MLDARRSVALAFLTAVVAGAQNSLVATSRATPPSGVGDARQASVPVAQFSKALEDIAKDAASSMGPIRGVHEDRATNAVIVGICAGVVALCLYLLIREAVKSAHRQAPPLSAQDDAKRVAARIEQLAALHEKGALTDEECKTKKAELLSRM